MSNPIVVNGVMREIIPNSCDVQQSIYTIVCLETGTEISFLARSAREAMKKLLYTLNLTAADAEAVIRETKSGQHLYTEHHGKTYCIKQ